MTVWNGNLNFYVLRVKGLKQGYIFKNRPFNISFIFNIFPNQSEYSKKVFKKIVAYQPNLIFLRV